MQSEKSKFMKEAIQLSIEGMTGNFGGPFGAVIVKDGVVIGKGFNRVTSSNDPTAHGQITAIRDACKNIKNFKLDGCEIYTSCQPCPMCLAAIYWARIEKIYFGCNRVDAANINFDDNFLYEEIPKPLSERKIKTVEMGRDEALKAFDMWKEKMSKVQY